DRALSPDRNGLETSLYKDLRMGGKWPNPGNRARSRGGRSCLIRFGFRPPAACLAAPTNLQPDQRLFGPANSPSPPRTKQRRSVLDERGRKTGLVSAIDRGLRPRSPRDFQARWATATSSMIGNSEPPA